MVKDPKDDVYDRLKQEAQLANEMLREIQVELRNYPKTDGCSTVGGVKTLCRLLRESEEENAILRKELRKVLTPDHPLWKTFKL